MSDPEYDIHPLDRDYSTPPPKQQRRELSPNDRMRRFGVFVFAGGLAVVMMAAIALGIFRGTGWIEGFGSAMHRFGMIAILVGGVMIIASYRVQPLRNGLRLAGKGGQSSMNSFGLLLVCNVIIFLLLAGLSTLRNAYGSPVFLAIFYQLLITITCGLLVTMVVWHRGMLQAYAIGALIAMVANIFGLRYFLSVGMPRSGYSVLYLGTLASVPITGLACAAYVNLVFPAGRIAAKQQDGGEIGENPPR
jgi:hypothetical protein